MHSLTSLALLASLAPLALAAPAPAPAPKAALTERSTSSFTVPRVRNQNHVVSGKKALAKAYNKYGISTASNSASRASSAKDDAFDFGGSGSGGGFFGSLFGFGPGSGSGSGAGGAAGTAAVPAPLPTESATGTGSGVDAAVSSAAPAAPAASGSVTGETAATSADQGAEFLSPVTIGSTKLNMDFDTGSADLWVFGEGAGSGQTEFSTTSAGFTPKEGFTFQITYGDGSSSSGTVGTDTVAIGSATVTSQAVEVATQVSQQFASDTSNDGLVGLGFSNVNSVQPQQQKTFFANIQPSLKEPVFTVYLNESGEGEYEFGNIDSTKFTGDITYTPVDSSNGFWQFTSDSFQVNGKTTQNTGASPAIADTGTSLVLVDDNVLTAYYDQIQGSQNSEEDGGFVYPCDADIPSFGVAIGSTGAFATIPGSSITYQQVSQSTCFGGIQSNAGQGLQIFGDVFLRTQFAVFDGGNSSLGIAAKA